MNKIKIKILPITRDSIATKSTLYITIDGVHCGRLWMHKEDALTFIFLLDLSTRDEKINLEITNHKGIFLSLLEYTKLLS